jgi:hypothetical protein
MMFQDRLVHATRNCTNAYAKGKRSFEVLAKRVRDLKVWNRSL